MQKILITGATGFMGSNMTKKLVDDGYKVYATYRETSSFEKCKSFKDKVNWVKFENINSIYPNIVVHMAWDGVDYHSRNNWDRQLGNFKFTKEVLDFAKKQKVKRIVVIGSQAESNIGAYGSVKVLLCNYLRGLFQNTNINWYWLRVATVFGNGEDNNWVIPTVINKLLKGESVKLTKCDEQYFMADIASFVYCMMGLIEDDFVSGIYEMDRYTPVPLNKIIIKIADIMGVSHSLLEFGAIPDRPINKEINDVDSYCFLDRTLNDDRLEQELLEMIKYCILNEGV